MANISFRDPQPIVKIHVKFEEGSTETFKVHKNFICYYSPFFDAAFNGDFAEGESQEMEFHEVDLQTFGMFVNWLYTQSIVLSDHSQPCCRFLLYLWILADRILVPKLQNQIIRQLDERRVLEKRLPSSSFNFVYEHTTEGSLLRKYIVDTRDYFTIRTVENYPKELLVSLVNAFGDEHRSGGRGLRKRFNPQKIVGRLEDYELVEYYVDESVGIEEIEESESEDSEDGVADAESLE